jgi:hypothetical protein
MMTKELNFMLQITLFIHNYDDDKGIKLYAANYPVYT